MIKAIIFDCFGVLYQGSLEHLLDICPADKRPALRDVSRASDYGYVTPNEYVQQVAELTGITEEQVSVVMSSSYVRNQPLVDYIQVLHQSYKTAMLSNIGSEVVSRLFLPSELALLFDAVVLSSDIGALKPAAEVYEYAALQLGVLPEECLMIDDLNANVVGAQQVGMQGIEYVSVAQLKGELARKLPGN